jgi:filamentous hemagglutinin
LNRAIGGSQTYSYQSALVRLIEAKGIQAAAGESVVAAVRSLPGVSQIDAIYRRDEYGLGASMANSVLLASGARIVRDVSQVRQARMDQVRWGYAADEWGMINLRPGDFIYGGLPGQSAYYTSAATLNAASGSRETLFRTLQVEPHPQFGYRPAVGEYEVIRGARVPHGIVQANVGKGVGGGEQFFIGNYSQSLQLIRKIELGP